MKKENPVVSVLMTSYNREKYISEAIESVLASTYVNFELLIVDDRSKDGTVEIANSYAVKDPRIKVYVNEQNMGDYPNRNKAASYARGQYLKYVDADDLIYPHGLEIMVRMMEQYPNAGYGLCTINQDRLKIFPFELSPEEAYKYYYLGPGGIFDRAPLSAIIKKDAFLKVGGFTPVRMSGDFDMWHKLSKQFNVVLMPQGMIWYRRHDDQEMSHYLKHIINYEESFCSHLSSYDCPLTKGDIKRIIISRRQKSIKQILKHSLKFRKAFLLLELKKLKLYTQTLSSVSRT